MVDHSHKPKYDLEERTLCFARDVVAFVNSLPRTTSNIEIGRQLIRAAGSVGANYIEANEALGKKDFLMRIKIARKESKEGRYWLYLVTCDEASMATQARLVQESTELMLIFSAILRKSMGRL